MVGPSPLTAWGARRILKSMLGLVVTLWLLALGGGARAAGPLPGPQLDRAGLDDPALLPEAYRVAAREARHEAFTWLGHLPLKLESCEASQTEMRLRIADLYLEEAADLLADDPRRSVRLDQAIRLLRATAEPCPDDRRADEARFTLALAVEAAGRGPEAVTHLRLGLERYPESHFAPDAWLRLGTWYSEVGNLKEAIPALARADLRGNVPGYAFSRYRLAWAYAQAGEPARAAAAMQEVLALEPPVDSWIAASRLARVQQAAREELAALAALAAADLPRPEDSATGRQRLEGPGHGPVRPGRQRELRRGLAAGHRMVAIGPGGAALPGRAGRGDAGAWRP